MEFITKSAKETQNLGHKIGASLKGGETIALVGDLGAGKTTFVQGLAEGLGIKDRIISPTFILMRNYVSDPLNLYHLDFYRLDDGFDEEIRNLGLIDIWNEEDSVTVIEWAEKIKELLPKKVIWIEFESLGEDRRKIKVQE